MEISVIIIFIGIILIVIDITRSYYKCPPNKTEFKYIPRTFQQEQDNPIPLNEIVGNLFTNQDPWQGSFNIYSAPKKLNIGTTQLTVPTN